ncbi:hypothetical protein AB0M43_37740 [Longispora sp. NPDC051575]|uniref:hypothetical protein n=1 Tax=Longispora sp. NPDC051575 TaxID=3154943 RepID=UPI00342EB142
MTELAQITSELSWAAVISEIRAIARDMRSLHDHVSRGLENTPPVDPTALRDQLRQVAIDTRRHLDDLEETLARAEQVAATPEAGGLTAEELAAQLDTESLTDTTPDPATAAGLDADAEEEQQVNDVLEAQALDDQALDEDDYGPEQEQEMGE